MGAADARDVPRPRGEDNRSEYAAPEDGSRVGLVRVGVPCKGSAECVAEEVGALDPEVDGVLGERRQGLVESGLL